MTQGAFLPTFNALPRSIPIFPLSGALLLPGGSLPLNIFEPRYLTMVDHALGHNRYIGMIQPCQPAEDEGSAPVYKVGCLGRISSFVESDDRRYLISLEGVIRFNVAEELPLDQGFRQVIPDFTAYREDLEETPQNLDRERLLRCLEGYFDLNNISADWKAIEHTENDRLINTLAMICPFSPAEKQAILEAKSLAERAEVMEAIMDMAVHLKNRNFAQQ